MDWDYPEHWTEEERETYDACGLKPDDLVSESIDHFALDFSEAEYMNALHDSFDDYDASAAI